ncbi:MAG: hypothetical protein JWQ04_365 [Pedosphaera sp.]|nr:hypothetical protein [Pedosphaera sp.]
MDAPPVITLAPRRSYWWLTVVLPAVAAGLVLFLFDPSRHGFYPRCTLYTTTGLYCPGCGSLRALHHLAHGHLLTALHYNPLLILSLPFVAFISLRRTLNWLGGRPMPSFNLQPKWLAAAVIVLIVFTILRNLPYAPCTLLAPP